MRENLVTPSGLQLSAEPRFYRDWRLRNGTEGSPLSQDLEVQERLDGTVSPNNKTPTWKVCGAAQWCGGRGEFSVFATQPHEKENLKKMCILPKLNLAFYSFISPSYDVGFPLSEFIL